VVIPRRSAEQVFGLAGLSTQYITFIISLQMLENFAPVDSLISSWTQSSGVAAKPVQNGIVSIAPASVHLIIERSPFIVGTFQLFDAFQMH
jgi:hypothetical protein